LSTLQKKKKPTLKKCWWRPDIKCRKCGKLGHVVGICKSPEEANVSIEQQEDEQLFVATCFATSNSSSDSWLIDSGCTNHQGNGDLIAVKGKGTLTIESLTGLKCISDVLYVPNIDQNLLSVAQLVEKGFKVIFEDKWCLIKDIEDRDVFKVKMKAKSYALNLME